MNTADEVEALKNRLKAAGASKAEIVVALAWACFGWPYVWGAWGAMCTPEERKTRAGYRPDKKENIYRTCPVLSGKQASCEGCPWKGTRCFDCRGFDDWLLKQVGIDLYGDDCGTQYNTKSNWVYRGAYEDMPRDLVCCVYEYAGGKYKHTGVNVGDINPIHCSTTVQNGERNWTNFAIPSGLYSDEELREYGIEPEHTLPTLRRGSKGEAVELMQSLLLDDGYGAYLGNEKPIDGKFGQKTEQAVKAFQKDHGLTVDGVVGKKTWAALGVIPGNEPDAPDLPPDEPTTGAEPEMPDAHPPDEDEDEETVRVPKSMLAYIAGCLEDLAQSLRGFAGGE